MPGTTAAAPHLSESLFLICEMNIMTGERTSELIGEIGNEVDSMLKNHGKSNTNSKKTLMSAEQRFLHIVSSQESYCCYYSTPWPLPSAFLIPLL